MRLFDTCSRALRPLTPIDGKVFRFYCCGPTVYGPAHIGNFRTFVLQDVLRRVLELGGTPTLHVRNITDVDDKTIRDSTKAGRTLAEFTAGWTHLFHADCTALGCLPPHIEPAAAAHIPHQVEMIETLMANNHAYQGNDGSVYFRIASFPEYGALSHLDKRDLDLGKTQNTRANADEYTKDSVADFVLWKARKPEDGENHWPSPWGDGRPGWHLECSAMIHAYLGTDFDLHSGGVDLVFPHHENEIAQSRCACGGGFAANWFHITHLLVDGGKMSKSLGNLYTLADLAARGHTAMEVRYVLVGAHYRRPLNFTLDSLKDAHAALARLAKAEHALATAAGATGIPPYAELASASAEDGVFAAAWASLRDDLNTPEALGHLFTALKSLKPAALAADDARRHWLAMHRLLAAFGLTLPAANPGTDALEIPDEIAALAADRWAARAAKDWARSDALRADLLAAGWIVKDGKEGYVLSPAGN